MYGMESRGVGAPTRPVTQKATHSTKSRPRGESEGGGGRVGAGPIRSFVELPGGASVGGGVATLPTRHHLFEATEGSHRGEGGGRVGGAFSGTL